MNILRKSVLLFFLGSYFGFGQIPAGVRIDEARTACDSILHQIFEKFNTRLPLVLDTISPAIDLYGKIHYFNDTAIVDTSRHSVIKLNYYLPIQGKKKTTLVKAFTFTTPFKKIKIHLHYEEISHKIVEQYDQISEELYPDEIIHDHFKRGKNKLNIAFVYDERTQKQFPDHLFLLKISAPIKNVVRKKIRYFKIGKTVWINPFTGKVIKVEESHLERGGPW